MGIIINVALPLLQPSAGVERFMGRDTRRENFALNGTREGTQISFFSLWASFLLGAEAPSTARRFSSPVKDVHLPSNLQAAHMRRRKNQPATLNMTTRRHFVCLSPGYITVMMMMETIEQYCCVFLPGGGLNLLSTQSPSASLSSPCSPINTLCFPWCKYRDCLD